LTAARGVSGNEGEIRTLLKRLCEERGATCEVDRMGNLIARKDGGDASAPHIMLDAHMDEVGLIVTGIRDDGLLRYKPVGGIDPRVLVSKRVLCGDKRVPGVIGAKAIHLQTEADRGRVLGHDGLFIDIGAKTKAEAEKLCPRGTYVVFNSPLEAFGEGFVVGRALDDRIGCLSMLRALEHGYRGKLTCAFTVQEEVGLRGATVIGRSQDFDLAIALEGTAANDLGDVPVHLRVCDLGKGVVLSFLDNASIAHPRLVAAIDAVAKEKGIACQPKRFVSGGNDAGALQRGQHARPAAVLSVPCRYIHSPSSVATLADIESQAALTCALLDALPARWAEIKG
ncbi:M20/M25/M40 family metallo-hydrolase, partial [Eubacteriales bacterium OttesenSCG-928-A19]|nr:M20/M25/M40 family metallo-hydrolase [Eubacteriales bacterium OttesenSCG-928-A19]